MPVSIQIIWDQLTPQQQIRIIHILVQMLLHRMTQKEEEQDEHDG